MVPPPYLVRRSLVTPAMFLLALVLTVVLLPLALVAALLVPLRLRWLDRPMRLFCFGYLYLALQVVGLTAALGQWCASGLGTRMSRPRWQGATYSLLGWLLTVVFRAARWLFRLSVVEDGQPAPPDPTLPVIVASRHAGPGDSFLLVYELVSGLRRRPRVVFKRTLLWDPLIDVLLSRTPNVFVGGEPTEVVTARIAATAAGMGRDDALLIFPEGGNFTPARRERVIEKLGAAGHVAAAQRAADLERLLSPRLTGLQAALAASPEADMLLVAHTGLDDIENLADTWRMVPLHNTLVVTWEAFPHAAVPRDPAELADWLGYQWQLMDTWVAQTSAEVEAADRENDGKVFGA